MPKNFLTRIIENKHKEVAVARQKISERELNRQALRHENRRSFKQAIAPDGPSDVRIIAEIKRASPSKGIFRQGLDAAETATHFQEAGAVALSVLTDRTFFLGSEADLRAAKLHSRLPVLRKDFIVSRYQILEAAAWGADAVLLIVRILSGKKLRSFLELCRKIGLDALVEVYAPEEIQTATDSGADIIGINNRNLETFETDIQRAIGMAPLLKAHQTPVVASGIASSWDIRQNVQAGLHNFLIGEHLVLAHSPKDRLLSLLGRCRDG